MWRPYWTIMNSKRHIKECSRLLPVDSVRWLVLRECVCGNFVIYFRWWTVSDFADWNTSSLSPARSLPGTHWWTLQCVQLPMQMVFVDTPCNTTCTFFVSENCKWTAKEQLSICNMGIKDLAMFDQPCTNDSSGCKCSNYCICCSNFNCFFLMNFVSKYFCKKNKNYKI